MVKYLWGLGLCMLRRCDSGQLDYCWISREPLYIGITVNKASRGSMG